MEPEQQQLRNLRDFLMVYNRMTEICFQRCSSNFNYRNLTMDEERCVDSCAGKLIRSNHRLMGSYVQLMPQMMQRRMDEMESKAKEVEAAAAAAAASQELPDSPAPEVPAPLTDVGADRPASNFPVDMDAAMPGSTADFSAAAEALSPPLLSEASAPSLLSEAATLPVLSEPVAPPVIPEFTPLPPALKEAAASPVIPEAALLPVLTDPVKPPVLSEALNLPVFNESIGGSSHTDVMIPHLPSAAVHTAPVSMPLKPTSISEDVPVSTVSAPAASDHQRAPETPLPPPSSSQ